MSSTPLGIIAHVEMLLPAALLAVAALGAARSWLGPKDSPRSPIDSRRRGRSVALTLAGAVLAPILTLALTWTGAREPILYDHSEYSSVAGLIPRVDALGYYAGALGLMNEGRLDQFNERRPVNAAFLAARLLVTRGNIRGATLVQVALLGVSTCLAAMATASVFGRWAGLAHYALLLAYGRLFMTTALSEALGLTVGCLGYALLVSGARRHSVSVTSLGLAAVVAALTIRAGPLLIVPAIAAWAVWLTHGRERLGRVLLGQVVAVCLGFAPTLALLFFFGSRDAIPSSNLSHVLLGLASGRSWAEAEREYASELELLPTERARAAFRTMKALELARRQPEVVLRHLAHAGLDFVRGLSPFVQITAALDRFDGVWVLRTSRRVLLLLAVCNALFSLRAHAGPGLLLAATAVATAASAPFIFPDGRWRVFAPAWPFVVAGFAAGFSDRPWKSEQRATRAASDPLVKSCSVLLLLTLAAMLCGPAVAGLARPDPPVSAEAMEGRRPTLLIAARAPAVALVVAPGDVPSSHALFLWEPPRLSSEQFIERVERANIEQREGLLPPNLPPLPFMWCAVYDFESHGVVYLLVSPTLWQQQDEYLRLTVKPWREGSSILWVETFQGWPARAEPGASGGQPQPRAHSQ